MSLQPPTSSEHALICGIVIAALRESLPSIFQSVSVRIVDDEAGAHLAGCLIEVGEDVYELEIRKR